jgi:hypothetical protein
MNRVRVALCLTLAVLSLAVLPAQAQDVLPPPAPPPAPPVVADRVYFGFDVGLQIGSQTSAVPGSFSLYDETATFTSQVSINNAPMINVEGGTRLRRNLFVGLAFTSRLKSSPVLM